MSLGLLPVRPHTLQRSVAEWCMQLLVLQSRLLICYHQFAGPWGQQVGRKPSLDYYYMSIYRLQRDSLTAQTPCGGIAHCK